MKYDPERYCVSNEISISCSVGVGPNADSHEPAEEFVHREVLTWVRVLGMKRSVVFLATNPPLFQIVAKQGGVCCKSDKTPQIFFADFFENPQINLVFFREFFREIPK